MSRQIVSLLAGFSALLFAGVWETPASAAPLATAPPRHVDDFMLVDAQRLEGHDLYRMADRRAVVIVSYRVGCAQSRQLASRLNALVARYAKNDVQVLLLDSEPMDTPRAIAKDARAWGIAAPILMDSNQLVGEGLGVRRTAEAFVIDPKGWRLVYVGGLQKAGDGLDALLEGRVSQATAPSAEGCPVNLKRQASGALTYVKDVAPILSAKCTTCHEKGGIGPFPMDSYEEVRGFAPMIREVIRTGRMPPWGADPHIGLFAHDRSLTPDQIRTIIHWVEAGSPRGTGRDPLAANPHVAPQWPLGAPDLILDLPPYKIPAAGVVEYQHPWVSNPQTTGQWLRAATVKVGSRQGLHHVLSGVLRSAPASPVSDDNWSASVAAYGVGGDSEVAPPNVGTYLPPRANIGFQIHYTPFGQETVDRTQVGLYFYKANETPKMVMHTAVVVNKMIDIPANAARHVETAYLEFPHEALLYSVRPHAHYRAVSSDLWIRLPNGEQRLLVAVPRYDFSWQLDYQFVRPVRVPAGSKLIAHYVYDNSKNNPSNPDPTKEVIWGEQSADEMFFTGLHYRWVGEESSSLREKFEADLYSNPLLGMLDTNLDGRVQRSELRGELGLAILRHWDQLDLNHDGELDAREFAAVYAFPAPDLATAIAKALGQT